MKKYVVVMVMIIAIITCSVYLKPNRKTLLPFTLANLEALANGENTNEVKDAYKTNCEYTRYYYNHRWELEYTVKYEAPCCVDGSQICIL